MLYQTALQAAAPRTAHAPLVRGTPTASPSRVLFVQCLAGRAAGLHEEDLALLRQERGHVLLLLAPVAGLAGRCRRHPGRGLVVPAARCGSARFSTPSTHKEHPPGLPGEERLCKGASLCATSATAMRLSSLPARSGLKHVPQSAAACLTASLRAKRLLFSLPGSRRTAAWTVDANVACCCTGSVAWRARCSMACRRASSCCSSISSSLGIANGFRVMALQRQQALSRCYTVAGAGKYSKTPRRRTLLAQWGQRRACHQPCCPHRWSGPAGGPNRFMLQGG